MCTLRIISESLPGSDILALALALCYRVTSTESWENQIRVGTFISRVGKKTHSDIYVTAVDGLLCIKIDSRKRAERRGVKAYVGSKYAESEWKIMQPSSPERHKEIVLSGWYMVVSESCGELPHVPQKAEILICISHFPDATQSNDVLTIRDDISSSFVLADHQRWTRIFGSMKMRRFSFCTNHKELTV